MRSPRKNSEAQVEFARELKEMTGVDLLDGRNIAASISLHHTAEMKRGEARRATVGAVDAFLAGGGKITKIPYGVGKGGEIIQTVKGREFPGDRKKGEIFA